MNDATDEPETTVFDLLERPWPDCARCGKPAWDHYSNSPVMQFKLGPVGPFGLTADHQPVFLEPERSE